MSTSGTPAPPSGTAGGGGAQHPGTPPRPNRPPRRSLRERWQGLKTGEKIQVIVAVLGLVGAIGAAIVGGLFAFSASKDDPKQPPSQQPAPSRTVDPTQPTEDATASASSSPATPSSEVSSGPELPLPQYSIKADRVAITIPTPDTYEPGRLDIDKIRTSRGGPADAEVEYESTWGDLTAENDAYVGASSASRPSEVETCIQDAQRGAIGELNYEDLNPGDAFCIVSEDENVAWMRFISKGNDGRPSLKFELTVWQRSS